MQPTNNIRDYTETFNIKGIEIPEGVPAPISTPSRISYLSKVEDIYRKESIALVSDYIRNLKADGPSSLFLGGKRDFYICAFPRSFDVLFIEGIMQEDQVDNWSYKQFPKTAKTILKIAIERMAEELGWFNTTRRLSCSAIDYQFEKDSEEPLPWHEDDGDAGVAENAFVILLSDPNNPDIGWTGGDFLYTKGRPFDYNKLSYEERQKVYPFTDLQDGIGRVEPNSTVYKISPSENSAILFGNKGMVHKITKMTPISDKATRLILTIFDYGEPSVEI